MKETWYLVAVFLLFSIIAGLAGFAPTGNSIGSMPPQWTFQTTEFHTVNGQSHLNLEEMFIDPDGNALTFTATASPEISATIQNNILDITTEHPGEVLITARDEKTSITQIVKIET